MAKTEHYKNFALKYRPEKFEEVIGQQTTTRTIQNALELQRLSHAYFFYGPRGCGKTTVARVLAKALNCTGNKNLSPTPNPCCKCPQCMEIAQGSDIDVLEIDAASNTQVDKVREVIIDTVSLSSSRDRYKVFILDEVHMLSAGSFNALLKTIEEPPPHVIFILATTERHKVPATILSRCQSFRFKPLSDAVTVTHLKKIAKLENIEAEESALKMIARFSGGALRDAITLLDRAVSYADGKITSEIIFKMMGAAPIETMQKCIEAILDKNPQKLHAVFETINCEGYDTQSFLRDLKFCFADLFYYSLKFAEKPFDNADIIIKDIPPGQLAYVTKKISKISEDIRFSDMAHILAEIELFSLVEPGVDLESLINRLENIENRLSSAGNEASGLQLKKKEVNTKTHPDKTHISKKLLAGFESQNPILYQVLSETVITIENERTYTLQVPTEFAKNTLEKNKDKILEKISDVSGIKPTLKFEISKNTGKSDWQMPAISDEKPLTDDADCQNIAEIQENDNSVRTVLKHIEGEIV